MFKKINRWREDRAWSKYNRLNIRRKAAEGGLKIFQFFDAIRRQTGYVK